MELPDRGLTLTPLEFGLESQKVFRSIGIFSHGFLAGMAFWHLMMVRSDEKRREKKDSQSAALKVTLIVKTHFFFFPQVFVLSTGDHSSLDFVNLYAPLSQPWQCLFYFLTVVCMISVLDRRVALAIFW